MGNFFIKTSKDDTFTVRDSYTCPWSRESQLYPGLHQQKHGQQGRGDGPASLSQYVQPNRADTVEMGSGDSMSWMLCSESLSPSICLPWALTWKYCDSFCIAIQRSYSCDTGMYWAHFQIFSHVMAPSGFSSSEPLTKQPRPPGNLLQVLGFHTKLYPRSLPPQLNLAEITQMDPNVLQRTGSCQYHSTKASRFCKPCLNDPQY